MRMMPTDFNFGEGATEETDPKLLNSLTDMYRDTAEVVNRKPDIVLRDSAPAGTDTDYRQGTIWVDQSLDKVYVLTSKSGAPPTAAWSILN